MFVSKKQVVINIFSIKWMKPGMFFNWLSRVVHQTQVKLKGVDLF